MDIAIKLLIVLQEINVEMRVLIILSAFLTLQRIGPLSVYQIFKVHVQTAANAATLELTATTLLLDNVSNHSKEALSAFHPCNLMPLAPLLPHP